MKWTACCWTDSENCFEFEFESDSIPRPGETVVMDNEGDLAV